jgi:hypothetical protein
VGPSARGVKARRTNLVVLIIFATAFGFVEAAVVYYLRGLLHFHANLPLSRYKVLLNLGFITFISPQHSLLVNSRLNTTEIVREASTIIMLACVGYIAGSNLRQRLGAFLVGFACWDITYYVFLKILDNWPASLLTRDVYFLIPVTWIGPVITPLVISTLMLVGGSMLYLRS